MRILFDQGTPIPLRRALAGHTVSTVFELGWDQIANGELLRAAEAAFDILITTDQSIRHQQNLSGMRLSILVLMTTNWPLIQYHVHEVEAEIDSLRPGEIRELIFTK